MSNEVETCSFSIWWLQGEAHQSTGTAKTLLPFPILQEGFSSAQEKQKKFWGGDTTCSSHTWEVFSAKVVRYEGKQEQSSGLLTCSTYHFCVPFLCLNNQESILHKVWELREPMHSNKKWTRNWRRNQWKSFITICLLSTAGCSWWRMQQVGGNLTQICCHRKTHVTLSELRIETVTSFLASI